MRTTIPALVAFSLVVALSLSLAAGVVRAQTRAASSLKGVWTLVAAEVRHPDGSVARDYGDAPAGRLTIDSDGRYALQIFNTARPRFASGDRANGTPDEYRGTVMGLSTHYGMLEIDPAVGALTFNIEQASYANWNGAIQRRQYELDGDQLTYRVPPRPNGDVPISIWRRVSAGGRP